MPILTGIRVAIAVAVLWFAYHLGGLSGKAQVAQLQAAQSAALSKALQAQAATTAAETARLQGAVSQYEQQLQTPNPIDAGLAHRVYVYATANCPTVPKTASAAGGAVNAPPESAGPSEFERLAQAVIDACSADAAQLNALIEAWPR